MARVKMRLSKVIRDDLKRRGEIEKDEWIAWGKFAKAMLRALKKEVKI